jgi:Fic family protein
MYNWELKDWPHFTYSLEGLENLFAEILRNEGKYEGVIKQLPNAIQASAIIDLMVIEALKTSEIEGEYFSRKDVMSSIKKNLGVGSKSVNIYNKSAEGVSKVMVDVRNTYASPLSEEKLFEWHNLLLPNAKNINVGQWRMHNEPMQVVSGIFGKEKVHFEAPPSKHVPKEMHQFITWFNATAPYGKKPIINGVVRSAIAHLYFESIHPFEDGNGRIGRAIAEKALSQNTGMPVLLSLSYALEKNKKEYYKQLQINQRTNEITTWIHYFALTVKEAQKFTEQQINFTIKKIKFLDKHKAQFNTRQMKVVLRMLEEGPHGFENGLNASKYMSMTKTSKATATRDLQELLAIKVIRAMGGGRSTRYALNL